MGCLIIKYLWKIVLLLLTNLPDVIEVTDHNPDDVIRGVYTLEGDTTWWLNWEGGGDEVCYSRVDPFVVLIQS
jgi:hypothetical protein